MTVRDGYREPITEISPVVPQTSFRGKTDGGVAKMSAVFSGYESPSDAFYLVTTVINILKKANDQGIIIFTIIWLFHFLQSFTLLSCHLLVASFVHTRSSFIRRFVTFELWCLSIANVLKFRNDVISEIWNHFYEKRRW